MYLKLRYSVLARRSSRLFIWLLISVGMASAMDRAEAALRIANNLGIAHGKDSKNLYGLYPDVFPGGYSGTLDLSLSDKQATLEQVVVTLVRWSGWDTVHYDTRIVDSVKAFVTPEGFPFYGPDPTPRSIPYVVVALQKGLITNETLKILRSIVVPGIQTRQ